MVNAPVLDLLTTTESFMSLSGLSDMDPNNVDLVRDVTVRDVITNPSYDRIDVSDFIVPVVDFDRITNFESDRSEFSGLNPTRSLIMTPFIELRTSVMHPLIPS